MPPRTPKNLYNPVKPSNLGEQRRGCGCPRPRPIMWPRPNGGPASHRPGLPSPHSAG